ncbi:MAG: flavodoxin domain-containing protein [Chloroflexota bacterium]
MDRNKKALVAVASKHGSTYEIASAIAEELRKFAIEVDFADLCKVDHIDNIRDYNAVILGSAIYAGRWMPEARNFAEQYQPQLSMLPVWLFSSGPLGADDKQPPVDPAKISTGLIRVEASDHKVFEGKLDPADLGFGERLILKVVKSPTGDFRDWEDVRAWADEIAGALQASLPAEI